MKLHRQTNKQRHLSARLEAPLGGDGDKQQTHTARLNRSPGSDDNATVTAAASTPSTPTDMATYKTQEFFFARSPDASTDGGEPAKETC